jgi:hypothetical protein
VTAEPPTSFQDPDMDMTQAIGLWAQVKMSQFFAAILRCVAPGLYRPVTPRRSVDRELEQFSPPLE